MKVRTVAEVIAELQKLNGNMPMFFDCPHCGRANIFNAVKCCAVVETEPKGETAK